MKLFKRNLYVIACAMLIWSGCTKDDEQRIIEKIKKEETSKKEEEKDKKEKTTEEDKKTDTEDKKDKDKEPSPSETSRPADYEIARYLRLNWKEDTYIGNFDFDRFFRLKDKSFITAEYLSRFLNFSVTNRKTREDYQLTTEDIAKITITDIEYKDGAYGNGRFLLVLKYNGVSSSNAYREKIQFNFNRYDYYTTKVRINHRNVLKLYFMGTFKHSNEFISDMFEYDDKTFALLPSGTASKQGDGMMNISLHLTPYHDEGHILAKLNFNVNGFRPISDFVNALTIYPKARLWKKLSNNKRLKNAPDGDVTKFLQDMVRNWGKQAEADNECPIGFYYNDGVKHFELILDKEPYGNGSGYTIFLRPNNYRVKFMDCYFYNPYFEIINAEKKGRMLKLKFKLSHINDTTIDKTMTFEEAFLPE